MTDRDQPRPDNDDGTTYGWDRPDDGGPPVHHVDGWPLPDHPDSKPAGTSYWGTGEHIEVRGNVVRTWPTEPGDQFGAILGGPPFPPGGDPLVDLERATEAEARGVLHPPPGADTTHVDTDDATATLGALRYRLLEALEDELAHTDRALASAELEPGRQLRATWDQVSDDVAELGQCATTAVALLAYIAAGLERCARLAPVVAWRTVAASSAVRRLLL